MSFTWNAYAMPWALIAAALLVLAGVIFARQRASRVAVLFCLMIALVTVWFFGFAGMLSVSSAPAAMIWARVALVAVCLLPGAVYDFTATALRFYSGRKRVVAGMWVVCTSFALITASSDLLVSGVARHPWGFYPRAGALMPLFLVFFFGALIAQLVAGAVEYRRTDDSKRKSRIVKLMISFVVAYLSAVDFLPMYGVRMRPVSFVPVAAFLIVASGSIRRHRFTPTAARAAREILETMADALFVIDADGRIRVINDAVGTLLGYDHTDLLGRSIDTLEQTSTDATITRTLRELARRGPIRDQERIFRRKGGEPVDVSVSISPVSEDDVQQGAVVIARDIRERKHAEAALRRAMKNLEESNRELEDFAYVASHDLQEPLRKIQAFGDLLKSKYGATLPAQGRDYVDRMQAAASRMQVLINDLLSFSRVTTKAQPFAPVDLARVAHEVAKDLETRVHQADGEIVIENLPTIDADPLQMRQLLQNLAGNALKFHRPGIPPRVEIRGAIDAEGCHIIVRDNGIGFDEKYADRIFTMFERLHGRDQYEGTGIGLAICRKIAERHGGRISARSNPGEGSLFVVTLPIKQRIQS